MHTPLDSRPTSWTPWHHHSRHLLSGWHDRPWGLIRPIVNGTSQGHSNQGTSNYYTPPWMAPKITPKAKRKAHRLGISLQYKSCRYTSSCTEIYYIFIHPSKAHRIAALKWQAVLGKKIFEIFTSILIICFLFWRLFCPELACSGRLGGWEIWSILCSEENACIGVFVSGLDVFEVFLLYIFTFVWRIPERCLGGKIWFLWIRGQVDGLSNVWGLDSTLTLWMSHIRL